MNRLSVASITFAEAAAAAGGIGGLPALARALEAQTLDLPIAELDRAMAQRLAVMREAVAQGCDHPVVSRTGVTGGDGHRMWQAVRSGGRLAGPSSRAIARALAVAEVNAAMGRIVAAPTAGSCGIVPGVLLTVAEELGLADSHILDGLWVAGLVGQVIHNRIPLSGAQGGCQAECGAAAAMAAAGACSMAGGTAEDCVHAAAIALKNLIGLVCDPVAGLVEVPCIKRNAGGAAIAMAAMEMALAGIRSVIPPDEVVSALAEVGCGLPAALRETGEGGLAATPTGRSIAARVAAAGGLSPAGEAARQREGGSGS
jgi:L-serine dehydratase